MADFSISRRFARDLAEWEKSASPRDLEALDRAMAAIVREPLLAGRVPSFYDPLHPSFLYRFGHNLIHFRPAPGGTAEFLNLYRR